MSEQSPRYKWHPETWVHEVADIALPTLRNDRSLGRGIPYYKIGKSVRYREDEVLAWLEARRVETTR